ncbi:MAG: SPFH domain-containing protein [Myxococcaceae bacterium]|nr:SPFH domain-containing protein [Myxococcaceae bacterium]
MTLFTVRQQTSISIERFGRFVRVAGPGLNWKLPFIERIARRLDLRIQQMVVEVETKTKDNVFVRVHIAVQYFVLQTRLFDAFYKLSTPGPQIESHVLDIVRGQVPKMDLDHVFENKDTIAYAVKDELTESMTEFGYGIQTALVTEIDPDQKVKSAMNDINAALRERTAANERGEAERILVVKRAQGDAESKALQGTGIANQRRAIIDGLQQSVDLFQKAIPGTTADDVMKLVLMIQYLDTLKDIGATGKSNTVFLNHSPGTLGDLVQQIAAANLASK